MLHVPTALETSAGRPVHLLHSSSYAAPPRAVCSAAASYLCNIYLA